MSTPVMILCLAAVVFSVWLSAKTKINLGLPALLFAFILGNLLLGKSINSIFNYWPLSVMRSFILICGMFYFVRKNGALSLVGQRLLYASRGIPWAINIIIFLVGALLSALGADVVATLSLLAAIGFTLVKDVKIHPIALVMSIGLGSGSGSMVPWGFNGLQFASLLETYIPAETAAGYTWKSALVLFLCKFLVVLVVTLVTGSFKIKEFKIEKPGPFSKEQITSLWVCGIPLLIGVAMSILGAFFGKSVPMIKLLSGLCAMPMLGVLSMVIGVLLKLGDPKKVVTEGMPWGVVFLSGGMMCLISVIKEAGFADWLVSIISGSVPIALIPSVICLVGGVCSAFMGAPTVFTLLLAIIVPLAESTGLPLDRMAIAAYMGAMCTAISPFSTGGATMLAYCDEPSWMEGNKLFINEIIAAVLAVIIPAIITGLGLY